MGSVAVISPEGEQGSIPVENLAAAQSQGFKPAVMMTSPEGDAGWMPRENAAEALKRGFTVGQPMKSQTNGRVLDSYSAATAQGVENVVNSGKNFIKGIASTFDPRMQPGENAITATPGARILKGVVSALAGAPAAVQGIAEAPDKLGYLAQPASQTAADLGVQVGAAAATEGVARNPEVISRSAQVAGKMAKGAVEDVPVIRQVTKIGKYWNETAPKTAAKASVTTDPAEINARIQEIAKGKQKTPVQTDLPLTMGDQIGPEPAEPASLSREQMPTQQESLPLGMGSIGPEAVKTPQTVGTAAGAVDDTALFQKAKTELGDAPISKVAKRAQELKDQSTSFEKTFGQPLSSFMDASGKFDMKEFLGAVVKPGTEPPAYVISRAFGADGVDLIREISGKPIEKWEAMGPLKAERNAAKIQAKDDVSPDASGGKPSSEVKPTQGDRILKNQDPATYMRMSGADEGSVLKSQEDIDTVNHFRKQFKEGKAVPPSELRMEGNNILEADGRHRALAAKLEGKKIDVIVRRKPLTGVKK